MSLDDLIDEDLVKMAKEGSISAFETIVNRYQKPLFNFILRMINDRHTAEDILQESFIKLMKNLPNYKPVNFKSYIFKITNNLIYDTLRKKNIEVSIYDKIDPEEENSPSIEEILYNVKEKNPDEIVEINFTREQLESAIALLPYPQRQVFVLHEYSGLSFKEISKMLNCSINTVLARMSYAVKKLRKILKEKTEK
jgi:RNA polymerase sigma-70 factor (ECF subfamily)